MTYKHDFPLGNLFDDSDPSTVSFVVIRSAYQNGWTDVDFDKVESFVFSGEGEGSIEEYISQKRIEALDWLNANCTEDNVKFEVIKTVDDSGEEDVDIEIFSLSDVRYLSKE